MPDAAGEKDPSPPSRVTQDDLRDVSAELSHLLAELARTPDVDVDVASGWTPDLAPGDVVGGRFELRRELGRGGFGVVFEALDRELGREVAFKAVLPGRRMAARNQEWVRREAEAVARLNHPSIVTLHDFGRAPTGPYLIFELLRGETLGHRLKRGPLPLREAVALAVEVARVLDHAHRAGVVHRDLKPGNVFLCQHGAVKVLDFGLAHLFGRGGVLTGGTPSYMAPEQKRSEAGDERTDLFALGVVLHEMLTGVVPARTGDPGGEAEPGPIAELPKDAAPARLRRLVARMLDAEPARRPATAAEVLGELAAVERRLDGRGLRSRTAWGAVLVAGAAALATIAIDRRPDPGLVLVAVGDFENGTGDRELDALSGLLATSLEQSRRVQVLPRWRLVGRLRELGLPEDARIDGEVARRLARAAGAKLLLSGAARREGEAYALEVRALDPAEGERVFSLTERAVAKASVLGALDRLAARVRSRLRDADAGEGVPIDRSVTADIGAYEAYWEGLDCLDRPSAAGTWISFGRCADHFREALARDPGFSLAHYQLAYLLHVEGAAASEVDVHLGAALRGIERMPRREAALLRAWGAHVERRDDEAVAAYGAVLDEFPQDRQALYLAGYVLFKARRWSEAVPYFQKALEVDPDGEWPLDDLVTSLAALQRRDELRALVEQLERAEPTAGRSHATVRARVWLGEPRLAVEAARRAVEQGGGTAAELDLGGALVVAGDLAEAEAVLERVRAAQPLDGGTVYALARTMAAQGRVTEGLDAIDRFARSEEQKDQGVVHYARAMYLAGTAGPQELWREVAKARALAPQLARDLAVVLALRGELERAAELARELVPGTTAAEAYDAVLAWRRGDPAGAVARLTALEQRDPWPAGVPPPSYLAAEVSAAEGDWREAVAAVDRYRALWPRGLSPAWTIPRATWLAAVAHERLGERERARDEADRLLGWLRRAEPDHALAREVRTLRQRVGK